MSANVIHEDVRPMAARWRGRAAMTLANGMVEGDAAARWWTSRSMALCREPWALARQCSLGDSVGDSRSRFALTRGDNGAVCRSSSRTISGVVYGACALSRWIWACKRSGGRRWSFAAWRGTEYEVDIHHAEIELGVGQRRVAGGGTSRGSAVSADAQRRAFCELKSALQISVRRNAPCIGYSMHPFGPPYSI